MLLYLKWITNKDLLYSTQNSAQCYVAARMVGEFGRECVCICVCTLNCSVEYDSAIPWTVARQTPLSI